LPVLLDALRTKDETVRCYAAIAFKGFDASVVPALIDLFREKDRHLHMWAGSAIVSIGKDAEPYLLKASKDADPVVRSNVAETLKFLKRFAE
jgi:HEAT repeat protein